jgi:hypothetical protein
MSDTQPTDEQPAGGGRIAGWIDRCVGLARSPAGIAAGLMALLALIGTAVSLAGAQWARTYWLALVPVYGVLCVIAAWYRTGQFTGTVLHQVLHWLSVAVAIVLDYAYLRRGGEAGAATAGLSSLLILGLGSLLAGIHLDWLLALVGLFLLAIFAVVGLAHQYLTLAFLVAATLGLLLAAYWVTRR